MSEVTTHWYDGLTPSARKGAEKKAVIAAGQIAQGDAFYLRAAHTIETAYRLYLKGDKARLTDYCENVPVAFDKAGKPTATLNIKGSMGYEYVKAAVVDREYGDAVRTVVGNAAPSVRALATLHRFASGDDEKKAEGLDLITAEGKAAKAEGRKPMSADAVQKAVTAKANANVDPVDREATRIARIVAGNEAVFASQFAQFEVTAAADGLLVAFGQAGEYFAAMGAKAGAATPEAVKTLTANLADEKAKATKEAARRQRVADAQEKAMQDAAASLAPEAVKPTATVQPVSVKRQARKANTAKPGPQIAVQARIAPDVK